MPEPRGVFLPAGKAARRLKPARALGALVPLGAETERDIFAQAELPDAAPARLGCTHGEIRAARRALKRLARIAASEPSA